MSTDRNEYQIPVIIDVSAWSYDDAAACAVDALAQGRIVGRTFDFPTSTGAQTTVESWWTVERASKHHDRNDNEHGVVVFEHDLDYLHSVLSNVPENERSEPRHQRLLDYFDRDTGRIGTDYDEVEQ